MPESSLAGSPSGSERAAATIPLDVLAAVFAGGAVGGLARYGLATAWPTSPDGFPWATFVTNVVGCFFIGALMTLLLAHGNPHRLVRPFVGVGVLGGFTTFSTFAVEVDVLLQHGRVGVAVVYMFASLIGGLFAVALAAAVTNRFVRVGRDTIDTVSEWS